MKNKKLKSALKKISLILALTMLFSNLPLVYATTDGSVESPAPAETETSGLAIMAEDTLSRTANSKTFIKEDGSRLLCYYPENIHYLDSASNNWIEYDNTLALITDENGKALYKNRVSDAEVKVPETLDSESFISYNKVTVDLVANSYRS
jgi:hypothetical protein